MALPVVAANGPAGGNTGAVAKSTTVASMPYFTPAEVAAHNCQEDLWLSFLGNVYNITPLIQAHQGSSLVKPLLAAAGKDVSHWFDAATGEVSGVITQPTQPTSNKAMAGVRQRSWLLFFIYSHRQLSR